MFLHIQSGVGFSLFSLFPGTNDIAYALLLIIFTSFFWCCNLYFRVSKYISRSFFKFWLGNNFDWNPWIFFAKSSHLRCLTRLWIRLCYYEPVLALLFTPLWNNSTNVLKTSIRRNSSWNVSKWVKKCFAPRRSSSKINLRESGNLWVKPGPYKRERWLTC